ncbi:MAG: hypothetical protein OXD33_10770, partial [Rhodobacteraceae bacterium]|nr:hypothetical protein [Paracoccaceae bacterium]
LGTVSDKILQRVPLKRGHGVTSSTAGQTVTAQHKKCPTAVQGAMGIAPEQVQALDPVKEVA